MSVSFMNGGAPESEVTASGIMGSLRCGNPDCNTVLAQAHLMGVGIFRVLDCPSCRRGTEYENTPRGWTVKLLPKRQVRATR
jgi:hypothetical protein